MMMLDVIPSKSLCEGIEKASKMDLNYILLSIESARKILTHLEQLWQCEVQDEDFRLAITELRTVIEAASQLKKH